MDLASILESLLIASESPLPTAELARLVRTRAAELSDASITETPDDTINPDSPEAALDMEKLSKLTEEEVVEALGELNKVYQSANRSFVAAERSKGWKIYTQPDYAGFVKLLFPGRKPERLSAPAMETLAIIAYRQPVTKSALEAVRGVSCDGMLQKLLDRELVKIEGRADLPGRPLLYATTELFLEHFGITDIEALPNIGELRQVELPDGTEEENPEEEKENKTEEAEKQLALSAVEKPKEGEDSSEEETPSEEKEAPSEEETADETSTDEEE